MATEENGRDLGFFNDLKAELVPMIAGLVSFTILGEKTVNNLGSYFSVDPQVSMFLFAILYFLFPIAIIFLWMFFINHRDGLKEHLLDAKESVFTLIVLGISVMIVLLMVFFFDVNIKIYLGTAILALLMIGIYGLILVRHRPDNIEKYPREYRQAKYQYVFVSLFFIMLWVAYFWQQINSADSKFQQYQWATTGIIQQCQFRNFVVEADTARARSERSAKKLRAFREYAQEPVELRRKTDKWLVAYDKAISDTLAASKQSATPVVNASWKPQAIADKTNKKPDTKQQAEEEKKLEQKEFRMLTYFEHQLSNAQQKADLDSRLAWAKWIEIAQFKGLLLFLTTTFFLLTIWYHSYLLRLKHSNETHISEVQSSRIAIYVLFLLIMPFFKPIDENSVNFDKPYLSLSNQFSFVDNRDITNNPAVPGEGGEMLDEKLRKIIKDPIDHTTALRQINESLVNQKKLIDSVLSTMPKTPSRPGKNL